MLSTQGTKGRRKQSGRRIFLCTENLIVCQVDDGVSRKLMQQTSAREIAFSWIEIFYGTNSYDG